MACACGNPVMGKRDVCRACFLRALNANPEMRAKKLAAIAERWARPGEREKQARICKANHKKRDAKPENKEKQRAIGRANIAHLHKPEVRAKANSPEAIQRRVAAMLETRLGWCPPEYLERYRKLSRMNGVTASEAKRIILSQIELDHKRELARLSPFERQERALRNGARLVANDATPSLANPANFGEAKWAKDWG